MSTDLVRLLESKLDDALALLERMVSINSFTANAGGVDALGILTAKAFAPLGFAADLISSEHASYGHHLFLRRAGRGKRRVLLVTHLDTVFPPDEEVRNDFRWRPAPSEGRIYGPGTIDIKGGTVMIWLVLQALAEFMPKVYSETEWLIAVNSSEEALSADFAERANERCSGGAAAVLVFEGGAMKPIDEIASAKHGSTPSSLASHRFTLVTARKGKADYRISVSGRGAHAGSYHAEGRNAIVALADCVQKAAGLTDYGRDLTVNVGNVRGGTVVNRVPHEAAAELELRAFDPAIFARAKATIEGLAGSSTVVPGAVISVENLGETEPWPENDASLKLVKAFSAAADAMGSSVIAERRGGLSDANYLHVLGPTLDGLGPSGGNAHCSEHSSDGSKVPEFVEINSFVPKAALCVLALRALHR
ncbi:MAG: M20/M25/M40 family metallo-hydrolase [Verrucomicrobiales bacterium]